MKIIIGDVTSKFITTDLRARGVIDSVCKARPDGYKFMPSYKRGQWDGFINLRKDSTIPTGLLGFVVPALKEKGYKVEIDWNGRELFPFTVTADCLVGIALRDYQVDAANTLLKAGRGIAKMATNAGKTEVIAAMLSQLGSGVIVVHRKELMYQTAQRIAKRLGVTVGMIGDGLTDFQPITVAMIQTLANMRTTEVYGMFQHTAALFIDECHHGSSAQYMAALDNMAIFRRYGFSGTPLVKNELNDLQLMAATGKILVDISNEQLIESGYSAKPIVFIHKLEPVIFEQGTNYHDAYDICIVKNIERNGLIAKLAMEATGTVLISVTRIAHGEALKFMIPNSIFVSGSDSTEFRQQVLAAMLITPGVYIATNIWDEGVDVPALDTLIFAAGGLSERAVLQRIGRGLRVKEDGRMLIVHDFLDSGNYVLSGKSKAAIADHDNSNYVLKHTDARIDVYLQEGFEVEVV